MSILCNKGERQILNWFAARTTAHSLWTPPTLGLHTADPGEDGTTFEVSGGSYSRQSATFTWDATNNRAKLSSTTTFSGLPSATVTHVTIRTSAADGSQVFARIALASPVTVSAGSSIVFSPDSLRLWQDTAYRYTTFSRQHFPRLMVGDYTTLPSVVALQAHTGDPGVSGTANVLGSRISVSYSVAESLPGEFQATTSSADSWSLPAGNYSWFTVWDATSGGNCLFRQEWSLNGHPGGSINYAAPHSFVLYCERTLSLPLSVVFASSSDSSLISTIVGATASGSMILSGTAGGSYVGSGSGSVALNGTATASSLSVASASGTMSLYASLGSTKRPTLKTYMENKTRISTGVSL